MLSLSPSEHRRHRASRSFTFKFGSPFKEPRRSHARNPISSWLENTRRHTWLNIYAFLHQCGGVSPETMLSRPKLFGCSSRGLRFEWIAKEAHEALHACDILKRRLLTNNVVRRCITCVWKQLASQVYATVAIYNDSNPLFVPRVLYIENCASF